MEFFLKLCAFASLMMATASFWVKRTFWLWGSFLLIALLFAYESQTISWPALIPLTILGITYWLYVHKVSGKLRHVLLFLAFFISLGLSFHIFPGFHNWLFARDLHLSPNAVPYNFWLNFDKPFIGIFLLAWVIPLIQSKEELKRVLRISIPLSLIGITAILALSLYLGIVQWNPKVTLLIFIWPFVNLFFVVIPEEAFFRGFIQEQLVSKLQNFKGFAPFCAIFITSLFFMLLHLFWVPNVHFLVLVFVTSLIYGSIYQYTKAIESSILCHFLLNLTHFLFFTYPALA
jgi:membrane protease YdiL (CAAX protease family)